MFNLVSAFLIIVPLFPCLNVSSLFPLEKYEGSPCGDPHRPTASSYPGTCKLMNDCPTAAESIRQFGFHNLERCGFSGFIEIVCCPDEKPVISTTEGEESTTEDSTEVDDRKPTIRKSVLACEDYIRKFQVSISPQILDGEDTQEGEFPHMGSLGVDADEPGVVDFTCGVSLISERYVVTAAHCILNVNQRRPLLVRLGQINLPKTTRTVISDDYNITNITIHPEYNRRGQNDIALIRLARNITPAENIHPACLYSQRADPQEFLVTGWGPRTVGGVRSDILQKAKIDLIPLQECNKTLIGMTLRGLVTSQICASNNRTNTCQGDSGGPLQIQNSKGSSIYTLVGITSYGEKGLSECVRNSIGVYTRIYSFLDWIETIVWP